jgi:hypothetical protein
LTAQLAESVLLLLQVVRHWRAWAPAKRAKRRKLRDVQAALSSSERVRIWHVLRDYTAKRRASGKRKRQAQQHFRWVCDSARALQESPTAAAIPAVLLDVTNTEAQRAAPVDARVLRTMRQQSRQSHLA